jgi:hypothetical protein
VEGGAGQVSRHISPTSHYVIAQVAQKVIKRCAVTGRTPAKVGAMMFLSSSLLYVQPGLQSSKPFHPGERQKLILFQLRQRGPHFIDLQFTAVRRHGQQEGSLTSNIITTSWGSANRTSVPNVQSWYTAVAAPRWLGSSSLRRASPSFQNLSLCAIVLLYCEPRERPTRSAVAFLPTARTGYALYSVHVHVPSNGNLSRSLEHLFSVSTELCPPPLP